MDLADRALGQGRGAGDARPAAGVEQHGGADAVAGARVEDAVERHFAGGGEVGPDLQLARLQPVGLDADQLRLQPQPAAGRDSTNQLIRPRRPVRSGAEASADWVSFTVRESSGRALIRRNISRNRAPSALTRQSASRTRTGWTAALTSRRSWPTSASRRLSSIGAETQAPSARAEQRQRRLRIMIHSASKTWIPSLRNTIRFALAPESWRPPAAGS